MTRNTTKLEVFKRFVNDLACLSTCKRRQVGCIIFPDDFSEVYSIGYNGPPKYQPNDSCSGETGMCGCIHAEMNAISKLRPCEKAHTVLLSTVAPCKTCAGLILNKDMVQSVYYLQEYRNDEGLMLLRSAGVITSLIK